MDANDLLMGTGAASAKFDHIGATVSGQVVRPPISRQQSKFGTRELEYWKDGTPKMQIIVNIQTDQRDPGIADDDGVRAIYIKGKSLTEAVRNAVRAAGAKGIEVGGTLTVTYSGDGAPTPGARPPKQYSARYVPPAAQPQGDWLVAGGGEVAPPVAQPAPVVAAPAQPAPQGIDPNVWAGLPEAQRQAIIAANSGQDALPPF
jgi:hypothetical protein